MLQRIEVTLARLLAASAFLAGCAPQPSSLPPAGQPPVTVAAVGSGGTNRADQLNKPYVIMVSFDGFRADYLDRYPAPNFQRVARNGVRAKGLIPVFPSKTFPNHYSIVTGQYAESHGIVANRFFDPARKESYALGDRKTVLDGSWYRGEPIWVTAERQGMVSASYFWVGSEAPIKGIRPAYLKQFGPEPVTISMRADTVIGWLSKPGAQRPHVITLYISDVDGAGHANGPESPQVASAILAVDSALGRLLDGIQALPLRDSTNVVLVSDHGMTTYTPETAVALESLIDTVGVLLADGGPNANLHISGGAERAVAIRDALNSRLQHGRAYLREDVPARLHYRADPRIGDVVVIMEEHYQIVRRASLPKRPGGNHGWDPAYPSMHGIFLVAGPRIKNGVMIPPFENVNIYPFLTELLGLTPASDIQGRRGWLANQVTR
ncbi:MAG: ectonucleotide pyrophosphatase/phosphodiesterase [Gemmatimonadaceae bacterium]